MNGVAGVVVFLLCVACGLAACAPRVEPPEPRVVVVHEDVPVEVLTEVPVIVEVVREVKVTVEVPVEVQVPVALSDWADIEELVAFLRDDDTDSHLVLRANSSGVMSLGGTCEDLALQLRDRAMAQGKYLSVVALPPAEYLKWQPVVEAWQGKSPGPFDYHAICMAKIGDNEFWYIEPDTDEVWLALYLD